jgi:hypothetical protein
VESLTVKYLWFGQNSEGNPSNEWKNLIWNPRRGNRLPKSLRHLSAEDLLIGNTASGKQCKVMQMESASELKECDVLTAMERVALGGFVDWVGGCHRL